MHVISLQSGSNGNCLYVEAGDQRLLFDAGISGRQAQQRLESFGRDIRACDALFISHDHSDHSCSAGVFHRKFGIPVLVSQRTLQAAAARRRLGPIGQLRHFRAGEVVQVGSVRVETHRTPHDAAEGVVFVVDDGRHRLGIFTDLGHVFDGLHELMATCDAVLLESNYDAWMLECGPYPALLKRRISGPAGHLSNEEAAVLLSRWAGRMAWACLGHLSQDNNTPQRAMETCRQHVGGTAVVHMASRYEPVGVLEL